MRNCCEIICTNNKRRFRRENRVQKAGIGIIGYNDKWLNHPVLRGPDLFSQARQGVGYDDLMLSKYDLDYCAQDICDRIEYG